jgi:hypothetical protein
MSTLHILPKSSQSDGSLERALPLDIVASSVTPFDDDGTINFSLLKPHIDWLIAEGADGLSPLSGRRTPPALPVEPQHLARLRGILSQLGYNVRN